MTSNHAGPGDGDARSALQAAMSACVSDVRIPASLLDNAVSRERTRKTRIRLASAAGVTAAVAAMVTVIAVTAAVPGRPSGHVASPRPTAGGRPAAGRPMESAAYVLDRVAAAQVNSYRMISVQHGDGLIYTDVETQQQRIVSALRDSSGQPYFQITTTIGGGAYAETDIVYQYHVYSTFTTSSLDDGSQVTLSSFLPLQGNSDPRVAFQQALKAGTITVVGHQSLNGRDTILIRVKTRIKPSAKLQWPPSWIWIDASSYLVVQTKQFVSNFRPGPGGKITWRPIVNQVTWLPPTPQNLAQLTVTPPAGFTKIPYSVLAQKYLGPIS
jgi:hypothetical protein